MDFKRKLQSFDFILLFLVCALSVFGIVVVGSASRIYQENSLGVSVYERQKLWFLTGLVMLFITSFIDYKFITKFYWLIYILNIVLLAAVLLIGVRMTTGVTRGLGTERANIQPSEFAKIFMILFLAKFMDRYNEKLNFFPVLLLVLALIGVPVYLVRLQPALSASLVLLFVSLAMIYIGGLSYKYICTGFAIGLPAAFFVIQDILREEPLFVHLFLDMENYHIQDRIMPYLRPETASADSVTQTLQSINAIGSGQLTGKGLYNGTLNNLSYVPSSHNDFIFAVIGEELGYVGCISVIVVMALIIIKCMITAYKADSITGRLIASGIAFMFAFQTFVNIGVATGMLPNTGMALPFVSYGGSSMWINMIAVGLVINVGMIKPKSIFEE